MDNIYMSLDFLHSLEEATKASYTISDKEKKIIYAMIRNNPGAFHDIDNTICVILQDGRVDIHDIPNIVLLVSQLFTMHFNIQNVDLYNVAKFIVFFVVDILPFSESQREIAHSIANTSLYLLSANINKFQITLKGCCK